ncbi:pyruvate kinase [Bellilinea sp.]|jgi:pyruvate kinase|uniref:pyruvate kinase n=1 Tax=Bellilinea sp. TaxID=2838785 RepID=UPI002ADE7565|nr:pyruvate kinase [Bellilinea sp.]
MMNFRKTKIVATIGPASENEDTLRRLIEAGIDVARLNFSHGSHEEHLEKIRLIRKLSEELSKPVSILQDLQGPKLRVGKLPAEGIPLQAGDMVVLTQVSNMGSLDDLPPSIVLIPLDVPNLARGVVPGNRILLDDGNLEFEVTEVKGDAVFAKVILGGTLYSNKGVNLPGAALGIPPFTEKDRLDLEFGLKNGVDWVAISFVHRASDIEEVRNAMREILPSRANTPIIAKLERPEAIVNLHEIIHAADGVMVARGDLGVETSPSTVPIIQKRIIDMANRHAKPVITATQMLDSMIRNPRPTRAEASDVANAIFDGTDAVMLSGETASGSYPIEAVKVMANIICEAEANAAEYAHYSTRPAEAPQDDALAITRAAKELAHDRNVVAIAVFTQTGKTALLMSKSRPNVPVFAFTPEEQTYQRMGLYWGVIPFLVPFASTVEAMVASVEAALVSSTSIRSGDQVVVISGFPVGAMRPPNFALLYTVGEWT